MTLRGWSLTRWIAIALLAKSAAILVFMGIGEPGVRTLIRATARTSALLFLAAFLARPLRQFWRSDLSAYLLANRRYLGVSMAVSHLLHGMAIGWLIHSFPASYSSNTIALAFGSLGFVFIAAMAATSSDAAVRMLGRVTWTRLHRTGAWYLWFIFTGTFEGSARQSSNIVEAAFTALFIGAALLRAAAWIATRRARREKSAGKIK
jgi:methionine sulfoxide reductase heme-binding subunit